MTRTQTVDPASTDRYDAVPYQGAVVPAADIRRLESIACLCGMAPAAAAGARILELGCGTGANLLPLALAFPGATIMGCDLARSAIAHAQDMAGALGIRNLDLRHADLSDVDDGWGAFDYIVCHDVYSWVTPAARRKILQIQDRNLAAQGVAFLSHDALPGWRLHEVAREMMRYHTRGLSGSRQTIDQARAMLCMAAQVQDQSTTAYANVIRDEYFLMSSIPDAHLYHVVSTAQHRAFYFHEFVQELEAANLQWLIDADQPFAEPCLPQAAHNFLLQMPFLERQQYFDFLNNCSFRQALLCHRDAQPRRSPDAKVLRGLCVGLAGAARLESAAGDELCLSTKRGALRTKDPGIVEAVRHLGSMRPEGVPMSQLFGPEDDGASQFMLKAFGLGAIEAVLTPFTVTNRIARFPTASALARLQAQQGGAVTNQKSEALQLTGLVQFVVQRLDGHHDQKALAEAVAGWIELDPPETAGGLGLLDKCSDASALTQECLRYARDHALLVPQTRAEASAAEACPRVPDDDPSASSQK